MNIRLNNIGIVFDSAITLDGLTVITGKNNSGKTTVGKTLYSLIDAVSNIQQKAKNDRNCYIKKHLDNIENILEVFRFIRNPEQRSELFSHYPSMQLLSTKNYRRDILRGEIEDFAHSLANELRSFDATVLENNFEITPYYRHIASKSKEDSTFVDLFNEQRKKAISVLDQLFSDIDKDIELIDYARESISQTLRIEFANQIQPVKFHEEKSQVELSDADSIFFKLNIENDKILNDGRPVYASSPYKKVFLIDNPFVMDENSGIRSIREMDEIETDSLLNPNRIISHNDKLKFVLKEPNRATILEQTVLAHSLKAVKSQIDRIIPGTFEFSSEGEYYIQNGAKLKISNLATGSKMFSIVKILLEKGELDDTTMLILDEPEAHLHPEWQNAFAETIVLLVKELGTNVLLTTHSPNFMLALDAYMRKYNMGNKTNFYQTDFLKNGLVQYHCVNDNMELIYGDFLQYLSEVKMLRNCYLNGTEEII